MATYPELNGRVAIVTGAFQGIGAAIAQALLAQGCRVAMIDRQFPEDKSSPAHGSVSKTYTCDVCNVDQVQETVEAVRRDWGRLDILINNAGVTRDGVIWKMSESDWSTVIDTNLTGYFHFIHAAAPVFRTQKSGRIINIASINGLRGKFGQSNYAAAKAGVIGLTKSVARELGPAQVNVNAVAPGLTETEMIASLPEDARRRSLEETALGRLATPEDVASVVVFLCSDGARHITGEVIKVDGGQYM
jgi:3-oxoacyl-[acyl-carrier protein] reductase